VNDFSAGQDTSKQNSGIWGWAKNGMGSMFGGRHKADDSFEEKPVVVQQPGPQGGRYVLPQRDRYGNYVSYDPRMVDILDTIGMWRAISFPALKANKPRCRP